MRTWADRWEPLSLDLECLIRVIFEPFDQAGEWPVWQYVDLTLDSGSASMPPSASSRRSRASGSGVRCR